MAGGGTWTTPKTFSSVVSSSAEMNTYLSGNDNALTAATSTITTTGTQTALPLPVGRGDMVLHANNATLLTLQGIAAGEPGQRLSIFSIGAGQVDLANQNGSATAANRIVCGVTGTISLAAGVGRVDLVYDDTADRWRVLSHQQGKAISPTFAAGDYTGSGSMTWTVAAGDVPSDTYLLEGRTLHVWTRISTSTVAGTPSSALQKAIPGGFTAAREQWGTCGVKDNATVEIGHWRVSAAAATIIQFFTFDQGNWAAATDATEIYAYVAIQVE
jgi:hypothetical protein